MIAAHNDPRRGAQRRGGRGEEIGLPGRPVVAMWAARAAGVARETGALAVEIIADVDDEVGVDLSNPCGQTRKQPARRDVAVLELAQILVVIRPGRPLGRLETAAGVAEGRNRGERRLYDRPRCG